MTHIARIQIQRFDVLLDEPYTVAYGTFDREFGYLVTLTDTDGNTGIGLGTPCDEAHDSPQLAMEGFTGLSFKAPPTCDSPQLFYDHYLRDIQSPAVRCGFDIAMWDLVGKQKNRPTYALFAKNEYSPKPNSVTVCLKASMEATAEEARKTLLKHPDLRILKIKLSGEDDVDRCRAIQKVAPPELGYILDANQGYSDPDRCFEAMKEIAGVLENILVIEQPTPRDDIDALARITKMVTFSKIYADESCVGEADIQKLAERDAVHGFNIKLQKTGGITPALRMLSQIEHYNLTAMLGCMMELPVAIAAATHLSLVHNSVVVTDLDSDLSLFSVGNSSLGFSNGARTAEAVPGLGCTIDDSLVAEQERRGRLARESFLDITF